MSGIPTMMKALIKRSDMKGYEYVDVKVPSPGPHQTLVKILKSGICGSDVVLHQWTEVGKSIASLPFIPGHESVAEIVSFGEGSQPTPGGPNGPSAALAVGDRVGIENHYYCETCFQCRHGRGDICSKMGQLGHGMLGAGPGMDKVIGMQGGLAEYALVPTKMLFKITSNITNTQAALLEPFGVAHNGTEAAEVTAGDDVLVIGCGTIGLFCIQIAKAKGASNIIAADIDPAKLELARQCGADVVVNTKSSSLADAVMSQTEGFGVGHLIECTGVPPVVNSCFSLVRKGGNVCLVGIPKKKVQPQESGKDFVFRSRTIRGIHGRRIFHTWREAEKLMASGACKPELVVSHDVPLGRYEEAFEALLSGKCVKILINPQRPTSKL